MITVAVRLTADHLERLTAQQAAAVARERLATGFQIEADWKGDVRVDTGTYRRSIHTDDGATQTVVSSNIEYALYNEYGTRRMAARPSATQAGERNRRGYADRVRQAIGRVR